MFPGSRSGSAAPHVKGTVKYQSRKQDRNNQKYSFISLVLRMSHEVANFVIRIQFRNIVASFPEIGI